MSLREDDLPVLSAVVETGNPSIIQSTRMGNEVLRELETLRRDSEQRCPNPAIEDVQDSTALNDDLANIDSEDTHTPPENTSESAKLDTDDQAPEAATAVLPTVAPKVEIPQGLDFASLATHTANDASANLSLSDDEIELLIDDVVDRHITALRQDIKQLLEQARSKP